MLIIHAHPRPSQSRVVTDLLAVLAAQPGARVRSLYALYPDFDIDVEAEQQALLSTQHLVWLAPLHWYSVPALMKHWIDQVLSHGWAYGPGGEALKGKACWWVTSAGGAESAYAEQREHGHAFAQYTHPIEQTARFCGMHWWPPFVVHGGHVAAPETMAQVHASLAQQSAAFTQTLEGSTP